MFARLLTLFFLALPALLSAAGYDKTSPFEMIRWQGERPEVQVGDRWYALLAIDGTKTDDILAFCRQRYGDRWDKRFCEDLVEVLSEMDSPPGPTVDLTVRDLASGKEGVLPGVALTEANRRRIWKAEPRATAAVERIERKHAKRPAKEYAFLVRRYWDDDRSEGWLSATDAAEDLDQLEWHLENQFSYLERRPVPHRVVLDTIRSRLGDGIARNDLAIQLYKAIALFGDGHSRIRGLRRALPEGYLPFAVADVGGELVACSTDGDELLDTRHPYVEAIDGVPIENWLRAAGHLAPHGSPQLRRTHALYWLGWVAYLRRDLGIEPSPRVTVTLRSAGGDRSEKVFAIADRPAVARVAIGDEPRVLEGNIGYLPIPSMMLIGPQVERLHEAMGHLRETAGLIIDVRGNGGGARDALRALFPYFLAEDAPPMVVNVAAYRLPPGTAVDPEGHLDNRHLYPATWSGWSDAERAVVERSAKRFRPEWKLPETGFSDWHFFVLATRGNGHYDEPVVVLLDEHCFSATDIFLGAFAELENVTLMGRASGGGSGRSQRYRLAHSGLEVKLSSMASFRPDGRLYEGRGVEPDVVVDRTIDDILGNTDSVLEAARKHLASP